LLESNVAVVARMDANNPTYGGPEGQSAKLAT
jgi:hypothetical protein